MRAVKSLPKVEKPARMDRTSLSTALMREGTPTPTVTMESNFASRTVTASVEEVPNSLPARKD